MPKDDNMPVLTPDLIRQAYRLGYFPMADGRKGGEVNWYDPQQRGILPLDRFHVPRSLRKAINQHHFLVTFDRDFATVISGCADARAETWINDDIINVYTQLHREGDAHSAEAWSVDTDGNMTLVGGVYGIALGGAFFGESMFSTLSNASRVALVFLAARLHRQGYSLFDAQFFNPHLVQFGLTEIPRQRYHRLLAAALEKECVFAQSPVSGAPPSSNDPGISCKVGTEPPPPDTGAVGAMSAVSGVAGFSSGGAGVSGFASVSASASALSAAGALWPSGSAAGACSLEYASDFAAVTVFLHSITQTS